MPMNWLYDAIRETYRHKNTEMLFVFCSGFGPGLDDQVQKKSTSPYEPACIIVDSRDLYEHTTRHSQPHSDLPGSRHATPIPIVSLFANPLPRCQPSAFALLAARLIFWGSYIFSSTTRLHFFSSYRSWSSSLDQTFGSIFVFKARQRVGARTNQATLGVGYRRRNRQAGEGHPGRVV